VIHGGSSKFQKFYCPTIIVVALLFTFPAFAQTAPRQVLRGHVPAAIARYNLQPTGRVPGTNQLRLAIGLPPRDPAGLDEFLRQLYDPASANYRKYLSPEEFAARFGPTESDYAAVMEFARTNGFVITATYGNRLLLDVAGPAAAVESAFHITLRTYRHPTEARDFFAPDTEPSVDAALQVADIQGLSDYGRPHPKLHRRDNVNIAPQGGSAPNGSGAYFGNDFRNAYVPGTSLTGAGQVVGLLQFDGFYASDISSYATSAGNGRANIPIQTVLLDGFNGVPTTGANSGNGEVSLDIEMAMSMAPGLAKIIVFEGNPNNVVPNDILNAMAASNTVKNLSSSWGWSGGPTTTTDNIFKNMATQGQSYFNACGDSDAFPSGYVDNSANSTTPSSSPYITQVGGTTLTTGGGAAYSSETVWNWGYDSSAGAYVGTSGGISSYYTIPSWQTNVSMAANGGSTLYRNIPDVALTGDNVDVLYGNGSSATFGGTSCAAPLWAAYTALINQQAAFTGAAPVGFINPALYALAASTNYAYTSLFHDTVSGNNIWPSSPSAFYAVPGYDLCTGLGTPNGINLINALVPPPDFIAITNAAWTLTAESATPPNGMINPGETVTVSFTLQNDGTVATSNLIATLLPGAGVLAPGAPQTYGAIAPYGGAASRPFTFTAAGTCGSNFLAVFQLQDGTNNLGTAGFTLPLGGVSTNHSQTFAQNFDGVTAPALPSGWTTANITGTGNNWATTAASYDTAPNSAFVTDAASAGENALVSPAIPIVSTNAQLAFRHNYSFDYRSSSGHPYRDGGVLEIKIGSGAFTDILAAGGSFSTGGYKASVTSSSNPLNGRSAWVNSSGGWQSVSVNLPAAAAGQNIQLRWNCGTDSSNSGSGAVGWHVDSISITDGSRICLPVFTDIAAGQSLAAGSLLSGQNLIYTLAVTNLGPQTAADVVATDTIPANATFISAPGGVYSSGNVVFSAALLPAGTVTNFTLTVAPGSGGVFTNSLNVATVTPEISLANNTASLVATQGNFYPPAVAVPPAPQSIQCGGSASFSVTVTGAPPVSLQWTLDGLPVPNATNSTLSLTGIHMPNHTVGIIATNLYGGVTNSVVLAVQDTLPPVITLNGANPMYVELGGAFTDPGASATDLCAGAVGVIAGGAVNVNSTGTNTVTYTANDGNGNIATATRTVVVQDTTPPTILWSFTNLVLAADTNCTAPMPDVTGTNYILATDLSGALIISETPTNNSILQLGTNTVVISVADASGNTSCSTNTIVVADETPPVILIQPQSQTNLDGTTATFSVVAAACTPLAYQWFFNSAVLTNATNWALAVNSVDPTNAGNYSVVASGTGGATTSAVVTLTVTLPPPAFHGTVASPGGGFNLSLGGAPGHTYVLEVKADLTPATVWQAIATNTIGPDGTWQFNDGAATNYQQRFYRIRQVQ
jgi:uncharacterized repeat protein (TIGR01451 family)